MFSPRFNACIPDFCPLVMGYGDDDDGGIEWHFFFGFVMGVWLFRSWAIDFYVQYSALA